MTDRDGSSGADSPGSSAEAYELQLRLDEETGAAIKAIAGRNRSTLLAAIDQAVKNELFLLNLEHSGYALILVRLRAWWHPWRWLFGERLKYNRLIRGS